VLFSSAAGFGGSDVGVGVRRKFVVEWNGGRSMASFFSRGRMLQPL
jgi:hypothetical protein